MDLGYAPLLVPAGGIDEVHLSIGRGIGARMERTASLFVYSSDRALLAHFPSDVSSQFRERVMDALRPYRGAAVAVAVGGMPHGDLLRLMSDDLSIAEVSLALRGGASPHLKEVVLSVDGTLTVAYHRVLRDCRGERLDSHASAYGVSSFLERRLSAPSAIPALCRIPPFL